MMCEVVDNIRCNQSDVCRYVLVMWVEIPWGYMEQCLDPEATTSLPMGTKEPFTCGRKSL